MTKIATMPIRWTLAVLLAVSAPVLSGCSITRYIDLMRVTAETDVGITKWTETYQGSGTLHARDAARQRIIDLREKQLIMAERIDPTTIPEFKNKTMTLEQAKAKKDALVVAATQRYKDAEALAYPTESDQKK